MDYDNFGEEYWNPTFETNTQFENIKLQNAFENMGVIIADHILESNINASIIWGSDFLIQDKFKITIESVEAAVELFKTIKTKYPEIMTSFLNATCEIINRNYKDEYEDLPF